MERAAAKEALRPLWAGGGTYSRLDTAAKVAAAVAAIAAEEAAGASSVIVVVVVGMEGGVVTWMDGLQRREGECENK